MHLNILNYSCMAYSTIFVEMVIFFLLFSTNELAKLNLCMNFVDVRKWLRSKWINVWQKVHLNVNLNHHLTHVSRECPKCASTFLFVQSRINLDYLLSQNKLNSNICMTEICSLCWLLNKFVFSSAIVLNWHMMVDWRKRTKQPTWKFDLMNRWSSHHLKRVWQKQWMNVILSFDRVTDGNAFVWSLKFINILFIFVLSLILISS